MKLSGADEGQKLHTGSLLWRCGDVGSSAVLCFTARSSSDSQSWAPVWLLWGQESCIFFFYQSSHFQAMQGAVSGKGRERRVWTPPSHWAPLLFMVLIPTGLTSFILICWLLISFGKRKAIKASGFSLRNVFGSKSLQTLFHLIVFICSLIILGSIHKTNFGMSLQLSFSSCHWTIKIFLSEVTPLVNDNSPCNIGHVFLWYQHSPVWLYFPPTIPFPQAPSVVSLQKPCLTVRCRFWP